MIYKPEFLFEDIDKIFGLQNGDIIMSGTPKGVGVVNEGDEFEGRILQKDKILIGKKWIVKNVF
jgi:2-keto-4-pentenoate hydratase/2-oxohepta-3-ene-1,7-dioic acid hydratase in catechol pathway